MAIKQLTLLGSTVKRIADSDGLLFHFTEAGVDVHNMLGQRQAYASLANVTCGAVNSNGVYLGTSTGGVYKLTHAAVDAGGDQTSALTQAITTATTPSIASNAVAGMDGTGTALLVSTDAGVDFLPDTSTVYSYTDANGCIACTINATEIAYILASGSVHRLGHPAANWSSGDATVYAAETGSPTLTQQTDPTALPGSGYCVAWSGDYLAVGSSSSPYLFLYKRDGATLIKLLAFTTYPTGIVFDVAWSGDYLAVATGAGNYLMLYRRDGDIMTKLTNPTALPDMGRGVAWNGDYLAVAHHLGSGSRGLSFYQRSGDALTKLADPADPGGRGKSVAWNGDYLAVGMIDSPYLALYRRDGDALTKLTGPVTLPPGNVFGVAWNGDYLAVGSFNAPYLSMYRLDTETLTKLDDPTDQPPGAVLEMKWNGDYLAVPHSEAPYMAIYRRSGNTLEKVIDATGIDGTGSAAAWSDDYLAVAHWTSQHLSWFLFSGGTAGLMAAATCLAYGADLFVGSSVGVDVLADTPRTITEGLGTKPVAALRPTPSATATTGKLAYGTSDGEDGGQFGVIDLSA